MGMGENQLSSISTFFVLQQIPMVVALHHYASTSTEISPPSGWETTILV